MTLFLKNIFILAHNVTYVYGYDVTTQDAKSAKEEAIILKKLQAEVQTQDNSCAPFLCTKKCANWYSGGQTPRSCQCSGLPPNADPNRIYPGSRKLLQIIVCQPKKS